MMKIIKETSVLTMLWSFLFDNDEHSIVSKKGWEVLLNDEKYYHPK